MASHFLELDKQELYRVTVPLCFYITLPAQIGVCSVGNQAIEINVKAERNLEGINLRWATVSGKMIPKTLPLELVGEDLGFKIFRAAPNLKDAKRDDEFSCTLTHDKLPVIDEISGGLKNYLPTREANPLLVCLKQFWNMENFYQQIERPHEIQPKKRRPQAQHEFQQSVVHLLTLAGFQAIDLGEEEVLRAPGSKVERGTLDLLAYYAPSKLLLLGACTLAPPKQEDIDRLLETQAILRGSFSEDTTIRFIPMIFSAQQKEAESSGEVRILNSKKLSALAKLVREGNEDRFLNSFSFNWLLGDELE
jgi:hypothetical protein